MGIPRLCRPGPNTAKLFGDKKVSLEIKAVSWKFKLNMLVSVRHSDTISESSIINKICCKLTIH